MAPFEPSITFSASLRFFFVISWCLGVLVVKIGYIGVLTDEISTATVSAMAPSQNPIREITVVAAVIRDEGNCVLMTKRPEGGHMGGLWEFPGGKIDDGESPVQALIRELHEELGIEIVVQHPLTFAVHEEPDLRILLLFFDAQISGGEPRGNEGQAVQWVAIQDLPSLPTPPADAELIRLLAKDNTLDRGHSDDLPS